MRKNAIVLALLGFSGVALAQSSVTLSGLADAGIGKARIDGDRKVQMISGSTMNNAVSRLSVRGVEDLGGGNKVGFAFETGLNLENGGTMTGGNGGGFWGREANLWVGGNWGTVRLGRAYSPADSALYAWELTGLANYNLAELMFVDAGTDYRNNSQISYKTPDMGGFSMEIAHVLKADHTDRSGAFDNRNKWDINLIYANGPISAALDMNKVKGQKTNYSLGGRYSFGQFAVAASYTNARALELAGGGVGERRGFTLGAHMRMDLLTLTLDLARDTKNLIGAKKYTNGLLEAKYNLSKRTFLYAAYLRADGTNNYGMGLQHRF